MSSTYHRTYFRSSLARMAFEKMMEDRCDIGQTHEEWYKMDFTNISEAFHPLFLQMNDDKETRDFLLQSRERSDEVVTQLLHLFFKFFLTFFMANTSANGLLKRGSMFVMSSMQFQNFLDLDESMRLDSLLDLGAGDGSVTQRFAKFYNNVYATELSSTMQWRLSQRGFKHLDALNWHEDGQKFDTISCLNLLDRCERPLDLLAMVRGRLKEGHGRLLVALVLPLNPYVEFGNSKDNLPQQRLQVKGVTFEEQVSSLIADVFPGAGFQVVKFSRVPYLCEGDLQHSYYVLHDALFLLKPLQTTS